MRVDERAVLDRALWRAREAAFLPGEYVGQESFVNASEILSLAGRAGVALGVSVLDLCCGAAGPGLFITRELGCSYLGVDASPRAIAQARQRAADAELDASFEVARVPPIPPGRFEVVLLLETMLAFRDKQTLLREVSSALSVGGRFAFTVEEGQPLTQAERDVMPGSDTVWLTTLPDLLSDLERAGLRLRWHGECGGAHRATVDALVGAYAAADIGAGPGSDIVDDLVASHRLWSQWLQEGRVRKFAVVAEKTEGQSPCRAATRTASGSHSPEADPVSKAEDRGMDVRLLYFDGCPHWTAAEERLRCALASVGRDGEAIRRVLVETPEDAVRLGFIGSPTILLDGRDPFATGDEQAALACRVFSTPEGRAGSPTVGQLVEALS